MDNIMKKIGLQFFADSGDSAEKQGGEQTANQPDQTQSAAVNTDKTAIDMAAIDMATIEQKAQERAERAAQAVVRDMLKQSGLGDAAVQDMIAEWKSKQTTPEQTIKQLQDDLQTERGKITAYQQEKILRGHGISDDEDIEVYSIRIGRLVTDGKTFEQAAGEYFEKHPHAQKSASTVTFGGTGKTPIAGGESEKEQILQAAKAAMRIK